MRRTTKRHSLPHCGWREGDVKRNSILFLIAATIVLAACAPATPPPAPQPSGEQRYLVDPRLGAPTAPAALDARFDAAWRFVLAGSTAEGTRQLEVLRTKNPTYLPAQLARAAMLIRDKQLDRARDIVDSLLAKNPRYTAAEIYRAEIAVADGDVRRGLDIYREVAAEPNAPELARQRIVELRRALFDSLYASAQTASDTAAIPMLRDALTLDPSSSGARILLARKLVATRDFDEARRALDPILSGTDADRDDVQEALAEIEAGHGRFQEAIVRYERLAHRDARFNARLEEIKEKYAAANMPMQYQRAVEAESITRADLAVLLYWKVVAIRFASNVPSPPIAVDLNDTLGREELVRALALGIYAVDPVTRRAGVSTVVTSTSLARIVARVLLLRGAACSRQATNDPTDLGRAKSVLAACNVTDPNVTLGTDAPVSGRAAAAVLDQVDRALR
jgi:lipopolysaccharide biosynthesis regulator YciM